MKLTAEPSRFRRRRVWISPIPGFALKGIEVGARWGFRRYIYRDVDGRVCVLTSFMPSENYIFGRTATFRNGAPKLGLLLKACGFSATSLVH